ncbi:hypothetical protein [Amycolatopsis cihanbeyliensis]|uniref:Uncharacterized protein n=1 Tax=Amycolatopsis cihanbeyliensis TaxID=1128664 RepID=A0A542DH88_AMYCI|nr:hypothetical protein [Amycolatopsis cihanbeyliensis]TQJ02437.1 hypothetical protein FB471_2166 [Amycolatopsis cihanbeyliensis]
MPKLLGNPEKAALFALILADGEVSTPELKKSYGVELRKETRESLNEAGLIRSRTEAVPHLHEITEAGRLRCEEVLASGERPLRASTLLGVLCTVIAPIAKYLRQQDIRLVDVIHPADLESRIRAVYRELSMKPRDWVRLARLRPKLNGADQEEVDRVLLAMTRTGLVHLAPDSNRKTLTEADHAAAIRIGSEYKHLVAIEES